MTTIRFFMIGTWTEGMFHFQKLKPHIQSTKLGQIQARLFRLPVGYPVLLPLKATESENQAIKPSLENFVQGQILEVNADPTLISLLDTFHGVNPNDSTKSLFQRFEVTAQDELGNEISVQSYMMNPLKLPKGSIELSGNCWKRSLKDQPPLPSTLTERQAEIVKQLGQAKGRDVVLVKDLSLYRDLMKLELIVDKGRRLALSALGKDVFKYLV